MPGLLLLDYILQISWFTDCVRFFFFFVFFFFNFSANPNQFSMPIEFQATFPFSTLSALILYIPLN